MEQLSQQWQIHWDSHTVQPRSWQTQEGLGPLALLTTGLIFFHIPAASLSHKLSVLHRAQNPYPPRTRNALVLQVTALESNQILRQLIQISHCSQKLEASDAGRAQGKAGGVWELLPWELALQNRSWGRVRWESFREQDTVLANTSGNSANKVFTPLPV